MKYSKEVCQHDHVGDVPQAVLDSLPENQGHPVRHRCAACAYAAGLNEAAADVKALMERIKQVNDENARLTAENERLRAERDTVAVQK